MCDTLVALGNATSDGSVILAKNSDREPNEAHAVIWQPRQEHAAGDMAECTYVRVPQVRETNEVLLCKPFWMWGCEMGANEHGVTIGNEAVFTKEAHAETGLLGMDMMRLALERASNAERALEILTDLLSEYGQGGVAGYQNKKMRYHNAFLIADRQQAWVLETAGVHWAAEKVRDVRAISNGLTIDETWDLASPGLVENARRRGWLKRGETFGFRRCYSDRFYTTFSRCVARQTRATALLKEHQGQITPALMMSFLRDHGAQQEAAFDPRRSSMASICMHAANNLTRASQTTCSLVAHLGEPHDTFWVTGTSAPCLSTFKPLFLTGTPLPDMGRAPGARYDERALWWRHERLHRCVLRNYGERSRVIEASRDRLEQQFARSVQALCREGADTASHGSELAQRCFAQADQAMAEWDRQAREIHERAAPLSFYRRYWRRQEKNAHGPDA
ncbi:MAG: C69 family dipeptidase [Anaerolineae bacterium]